MQQKTALAVLVAHRWNLPVLAELFASAGGARYVTLARRLGVGRASLSVTLNYLIKAGLVRRNSGYGHPLRPEYLLTGRAMRCGAVYLELVRLIARLQAANVAYRKWSLPIVYSIGDRQMRFGEIRQALGTLTARALTLGLKALEDIDWIEREIADAYPPVAVYRLGSRGRAVADALQAVCREQESA